MNRESGIKMNALPYVKQIASVGSCYIIGSSTQCSVMTWGGKEVQGGGDICIHRAETNTT